MNIAETAAIVNALNSGGGGGGAGGGWDFVIKCDNTTSTIIYSLDSGDFDDVIQKIQNHTCLTGYCFAFDTVNVNVAQNMIFHGAGYSEDDDFIITTWRTLENPQNIQLVWERDGTIYED